MFKPTLHVFTVYFYNFRVVVKFLDSFRTEFLSTTTY